MLSLDTIHLYTANGHLCPLPTLWQTQPQLLFFLRSPGCGICRHQLFALKRAAPTFTAAGLGLAAITLAKPALMAGLAATYQLPFPF